MKTKEYKGFTGEYRFEEEDNIYFGKISNITDLVTFEAQYDGVEAQKAFEEAVDDYLELCKEVGK